MRAVCFIRVEEDEESGNGGSAKGFGLNGQISFVASQMSDRCDGDQGFGQRI